jgi:hypothetical protein
MVAKDLLLFPIDNFPDIFRLVQEEVPQLLRAVAEK